jgi:KaiC/GvpD/RAD55 family RecA-like ATPase
MQFVYYGVEKHDEPGLYITLEQTRQGLVKAMKSFGMRPEMYEGEGDLTLADLGWFSTELGPAAEAPSGLAGMDLLREQGRRHELDMGWFAKKPDARAELEGGFVGFRTLRDIVDHLVETRKIRRLAVDSVAAIGLLSGPPELFRKELFSFGRFLRDRKLTSLLVTEAAGPGGAVRFGVENFLADTHICLNLRNLKGEFLRTVSVSKMRFGTHDPGVHPFEITSRGMEINTREFVRV